MVKDRKVGRPSFEKMFASVEINASINYALEHILGEVYEMDEDHDGKLILRVRRQLPKGVSAKKVCLIRPHQEGMSMGSGYNLAMDYGYRPAVHLELKAALQQAVPEHYDQMFDLADRAMYACGQKKKALALSVACMGSAVTGKTGELIPVQEVIRSCGRPCRMHLRKLDFDGRMFPAQWMAFVAE